MKNGIINQEELNKLNLNFWNKKGKRIYLKLDLSYISNYKSDDNYDFRNINVDCGYVEISENNKISYKHIKFIDKDLLKNSIKSLKMNIIELANLSISVRTLEIKNEAFDFDSIKSYYNIAA